jgi:hypothetical protein
MDANQVISRPVGPDHASLGRLAEGFPGLIAWNAFAIRVSAFFRVMA